MQHTLQLCTHRQPHRGRHALHVHLDHRLGRGCLTLQPGGHRGHDDHALDALHRPRHGRLVPSVCNNHPQGAGQGREMRLCRGRHGGSVQSDHAISRSQQPLNERQADKPARAGDQHRHASIPHPSPAPCCCAAGEGKPSA